MNFNDFKKPLVGSSSDLVNRITFGYKDWDRYKEQQQERAKENKVEQSWEKRRY